ncbi:MAG: response regulator [candidate division Zixibacteria bacterium]|nr:response regulator [candidate division Zixibacteria bacterium]
MEDILESAGYRSIAAMDGKQGLQQAQLHHPDLIISDILMPNMDGFEFCHSVRNTPELARIPFLFLSGAYVSEDDERFALKIGANRFMRRPFQTQTLLDTVEEMLAAQQTTHMASSVDVDEKYYLKEHINRLTQALEDKVVELEAVMEQHVRLLRDAKRHEAELQRSLSDLRDTQTFLVQSERLSAVGQLVAGVAHELNNPLAIILGYSQLMLRMSDTTPRIQECLRKLEEAAQRCQRIVQHLTVFAQKQKVDKRPVNVNDVLYSVLDIREDQLRANQIRVSTTLDARPMTVYADFQQLQQVLLSLINNAQEALLTRNASDRDIRIATRLQDDQVIIDLIDNGPGIDDEHIARLFEPFFTTKEFGKGIGLGLSICYGIIKEHQGDIRVTHTEGGGATFTILLPPSRSNKSQEPTSSSESPNVQPSFRILIIDDEPAILDFLTSTFRQNGYTVDAVLSGSDGMAHIDRTQYDLALLDIRLPDSDGKQLYREIIARRPELEKRIIFITGDTVSQDTLDFVRQTGNPCLTKPFDIERLRLMVADLIDKGSSA